MIRIRGPALGRIALAGALAAACPLPVLAATFTVTRTSNGGGGSLRTAINNANGSPGSNIRFAIPTSDGGYNPATGIFTIRLTSALPAITAAGTLVDGTTQTASMGDTNPGTLGTGGTVGVDLLPLPTVNRPEIQIVDGGNLAIGLDVQASNVTLRGLAIYGFGTASNSDTSGNIRIGNVSGALIEQNVLGTPAGSFTDPGAGARSTGDNVRCAGGDNGILRNNLIGYGNGKGLELNNGSNGWLVVGNEIRGNGIGTPNLDAIDIENGSGGATVRGNLLTASAAVGLEMYQSSGSNRAENNTITANGAGPGSNETPGVRLYGAGNTIDRNIIAGNFGAGLMVTSGSTGNVITRNSVYGNGPSTGQIGIDLLAAADNQNLGTAPFVTRNDSGDGDAGGNGLPNFPVITVALLGGGDLTLAGYARPGSVIELFGVSADPSGFGEGITYLATQTEGSGADTDATAGTYTSPVNGLNVGTDTTNRFRFRFPAPAGVAVGSVLTSTSTLGGNTSEFGGNVTVASAADVALVNSVVPAGPQPPGTELGYTVVFTNGGGTPVTSLVLDDPIPNDTDFKVGSVTTDLGTTGLTVAVSYSSDGGATWTYTPAGGAGGAPAGFDRLTTHIRWTFSGTLGNTPPSNQGSIGFVARIR